MKYPFLQPDTLKAALEEERRGYEARLRQAELGERSPEQDAADVKRYTRRIAEVDAELERIGSDDYAVGATEHQVDDE